jgi:adenylate kinase family enzyme
MKRIMLIGSGGAGKTTLAHRLSAATGIPTVHLDTLYWRPGWEPTPESEWLDIVRRETARDAWIMDGNYGGSMPIRLAVADTVVFLDAARIRCAARVLKRAWNYRGRNRPDLPQGCPEQFSFEFLSWIWNYPGSRRPGILARLEVLPHATRVAVLRTQAEIDAWFDEVVGATASASASRPIE